MLSFSTTVSLAQAKERVAVAFERNRPKKIAALAFVGGPASGSIMVAESILADLAARQWTVLGMRQGFRDLMYSDPLRKNLHYVNLNAPQPLPNGLLVNSRENPLILRNGTVDGDFIANDVLDPDNHVTIIAVINKLLKRRVSALILLGGDGTLSLSYCLGQVGIPVIHVIKSADDDYILFLHNPQAGHTYGYESAVNALQQPIINAKEDAQSENSVIFIQCLGRRSGAIAYQAAVNAEADGVWAAEDVEEGETLDQFCAKIADFIVDRRRRGFAHAVVVLSENLAIRFQDELGKLSTDKLLNPRPSTVNIGAIVAERVEKIYRAKMDGHRDRLYRFRSEGCMFTARVVPRQAMSVGDKTYCQGLGSATAKLVLAGEFGTSARWDPFDDTLFFVPLKRLVDPNTGRSIKRTVARDSALYHMVEQLRARERASKPAYPWD